VRSRTIAISSGNFQSGIYESVGGSIQIRAENSSLAAITSAVDGKEMVVVSGTAITHTYTDDVRNISLSYGLLTDTTSIGNNLQLRHSGLPSVAASILPPITGR
jgi:hypothetical protein